jgi:hypothetical protein
MLRDAIRPSRISRRDAGGLWRTCVFLPLIPFAFAPHVLSAFSV